MSFAVVPAKAAMTDAEIMAQIAALQAQLSAPSASAAVMFNTNLTLGSKGADVTALQNWLISKGHSIPAGATGYFGSQTQAALAAYQAAAGISPAAGYFGPITRAKVNASASGPSTGPVSTTGLSGNGRLTNISTLGDVVSDIKEGDGVTKLVGVSVDATDGDVLLQRMDATITIGAGTNSASLSKYFQSVSVYVDGNKVATMSADSGDKNGKVWTFRFAGINTKIAKGHTANIYVEATPITSVGTNENGTGGTIALDASALRYSGADGISETYGTSVSQSYTVSAATNGKVTFSEGSGNPTSSVVKVDANNTTSGVKILEINAKAKNTDVTVNDLAIQLATSDNNLNDVIQTVNLMDGSTVVRSKSVSTGTTGTVVFDNVNADIAKDATKTWSVVVDLKKQTAYSDPTTLVASTTPLLTGHDIEDSHGNTVTGGNLTGSAAGKVHTLQATGITVTAGSIAANKTVGTTAGSGDNTQFVIPFTVKAGDDDLYINRTGPTRLATAATAPGSNQGVTWATTTSSTFGVTSATIGANLSASDTNSSDAAGYYKIPAGSSRTFTLNVTMTATSTGFTGVQLLGINYSLSTSFASLNYTSGLDQFKTTDISMTTH
jgi:hypothetical protein